MNRAQSVRLVIATAVAVSVATPLVAPAFAENVCVMYDYRNRRGLCVNVDIPPDAPLPR